MSDQIRREHDYILDYLALVDYNGNEHNFSGHYIYFTYEESIFGMPHGQIFCLDTVDYPTLLPMIGEERLKASFTRQDANSKNQELLPSIIFDMAVYSLKGRQQSMEDSRKKQTYTLSYTADTMFRHYGQRVFKAYKGKLYSDIVQEVHDEFIREPIDIEPTIFEQDYTICNERPFEAIKKIATRSMSASSDIGNFYVYFQDRDTFHFKTVGKLFGNETKIKLFYEIKNVGDKANLQELPIERDVYNVNSFSQTEPFDITASALNGEAASCLLTIDPIRRKYSQIDFCLKDEFDEFAHVESNKPWTDANKMHVSPKSNPFLAPTNFGHDTAEYIASREPGIKPQFLEEYRLRKISQKNQLFRNAITTTVTGDPRVKAGDMIEFNIPEFLGKTSDENPEELSRYLRGRYLVVAVCHVVEHGQYYMNLELVKDTFFGAIENRDPYEEYKNIY